MSCTIDQAIETLKRCDLFVVKTRPEDVLNCSIPVPAVFGIKRSTYIDRNGRLALLAYSVSDAPLLRSDGATVTYDDDEDFGPFVEPYDDVSINLMDHPDVTEPASVDWTRSCWIKASNYWMLMAITRVLHAIITDSCEYGLGHERAFLLTFDDVSAIPTLE